MYPSYPANAAVLSKRRPAIEFIDQANSPARPPVSVSRLAFCGLVFRLGGFQAGQEVAALNDATILLHAREKGLTVLTQNHHDVDRMSQVIPGANVLFHRPV
jgi:hypothetical protein